MKYVSILILVMLSTQSWAGVEQYKLNLNSFVQQCYSPSRIYVKVLDTKNVKLKLNFETFASENVRQILNEDAPNNFVELGDIEKNLTRLNADTSYVCHSALNDLHKTSTKIVGVSGFNQMGQSASQYYFFTEIDGSTHLVELMVFNF